MKKLFSSASEALLVLLFVYAACSKLLAFDDFRGQLHNQPIPYGLAEVLWYGLPALELLAAALLLFTRTVFGGLVLSAFLLLVFSGYISLVLLGAWARVPCSCGGILNGMSWGPHLAFNLLFLAISLAAIGARWKKE